MPTGQTLPATCFINKILLGIATPISYQFSMAASIGRWQSWVVTTEMVWSSKPTIFTAWLVRDHIPMPATDICLVQEFHWSKRWAAGLCPSPATMTTQFAPPFAILMFVAVIPYLRICLSKLEGIGHSDTPSKRLHLHTPSHRSQVSPSKWLHLSEHCFLIFVSNLWSHEKWYLVQRRIIKLMMWYKQKRLLQL